MRILFDGEQHAPGLQRLDEEVRRCLFDGGFALQGAETGQEELRW